MAQSTRKTLTPFLIGGLFILAAFWLLGKLQVNERQIYSDSAPVTSSAEQSSNKDTNDSETIIFQEEQFDVEEARRESLKVLPYSLRDLEPPSQLDTDANGNLVLNDKIRPLFDFYLSAKGEEDLLTVIARVNMILSELPEPAQSEAKDIFRNYIAYLQDTDNQTAAYNTTSMPGQWDMDQIISLKTELTNRRRLYFSPEVAELFFKKDDIFDNYAVKRLSIMNDPLLSKEEKAQALTELTETMPEEYLRSERESLKIENYRKTMKVMTKDKVDSADIDLLRRDTFGDEAAERLAELDKKRAAWDQKVSDYRAALQQEAEYYNDKTSPEYLTARDRIRDKYFTETEKRRITALDKIQASSR